MMVFKRTIGGLSTLARHYQSEHASIITAPAQAYILRRGTEWEAASLCHLESVDRINNALPDGMAIDYPATHQAAISWAAEIFHLIAQYHGSQAEWLPDCGLLLTDDIREVPRDFPYRQWLDTAINEIIWNWVLGYFWPVYKAQAAST